MNDSTTLPAVRGADLPEASAALDAAVAAAIEAATSPNTRRMYRAQARVFGSWCDANGLAALPATLETVARYLTARAEAGAAVATVHAARSAIAAMHRAAGVTNPCDSEIVRITVRGLTRQHRAPQRQAPPLTADGLAAIFATAHLPRPRARGGKGLETPAVAARRAAVDRANRAIAALLFQGALRRSEVAALTWADVQPGTAEGTCLVRVRAGKTNQDGRRPVRRARRDVHWPLRAARARFGVDGPRGQLAGSHACRWMGEFRDGGAVLSRGHRRKRRGHEILLGGRISRSPLHAAE